MRTFVYFDANVFGNLADSTPIAKKKTQGLREVIDHRKISICPSFECFAELIFALEFNRSKYEKLRDIYYSFVDWQYILKDAGDIFKEDILSFARKGKQTSAFANLDDSCEFMSNVRSGKDVLTEAHLRTIINMSHKKAQMFTSAVLHPGPLDHLKGKYTDRDFLRLWQRGSTAEIMASDFARRFRVITKCKQRGIINLLRLPTIRLAIGYILFSWYKQLSSNAKVVKSDAYDYRHAVLAGAVGNIVTEDKKLRNAIHAVPDHNVRVWTLDEFITGVI
jgi:hypothetical protein